MGKVLKADATAAPAFVRKNLGSNQPHVWLTFRLFFAADVPAYICGDGAFTFTQLFNATPTLADYVLISCPDYESNWNGGGSAVGGAWLDCEFHHVNGGASDFYIGGVLVFTGTDDGMGGDIRFVDFGLDATPDAHAVMYFDDVKIGTTRGASDLFADDFEGGDLSAWTSTTGSVSVTNDPLAPASAAPPMFFVAFDDPTLEADPTWTQLG